MGLMDDLKGKAQDVMNDPKKREEIERIAKEKNISMDAAKAHFMNKHQE
jgi:hypothetical protein